MRYRELDLNLLMALDKLLELRNVTAAAEQMNVTQSAMSNMLGRLRTYFDDPLLVQMGRQMEPTARARDLAAPVRDILVRIEATVHSPSEFDPALSSRQFSMMVSDYSLTTVIPALVRRIAQSAPGVKLSFTPQVMQPSAQLEQGGADLVIAPAIYCACDHPSEVLLRDPMVCVMDAANPARHGFDAKALAESEHVLMLPPSDGESYSLTVLRRAGLSVTAPIQSFSFASLPSLVRGTNRITVVQSLLAQEMAQADDLVVLPLPIAVDPLEQRLLWHKLRSPDPGIAWLREQAHLAAADVQGRLGSVDLSQRA